MKRNCDEDPVDLHPAERVRHGWRTPDFQANREWGAQKVAFTEPMDVRSGTGTQHVPFTNLRQEAEPPTRGFSVRSLDCSCLI